MTDSRDKLRALWLVMLLVVSPIAGAGAFSGVEPVAGNPSAHVTVDEDGGADYTSIGAALDVVTDGGTVLVRPASDGHYNEPVVVDRNVTLAGTGATNLSTAPVTLNVTAYNESASEAITGNPNRTVVDINYTDPADSSEDIYFEFTSSGSVVASNTTATVSGGTFTNRTVLTGYVNESTELGLIGLLGLGTDATSVIRPGQMGISDNPLQPTCFSRVFRTDIFGGEVSG